MYTYIAYGIPIKSEIPLRSLCPYNERITDDFILVKLGTVPLLLSEPPEFIDEICSFNVNEFIFFIPNILKMYIRDGKEIVLESLNTNIDESLLYFYSNGLAAVMYQRRSIVFHVSGVFLNPNEVLLIAAPSGTGKSTTAVKLQEYGYSLFTDDTAVLTIENGQVYAEASYPMVRLWKQSISQQTYFNEEEKLHVYSNEEYDKYGFNFHSNFSSEKCKVKGFVFLEKFGSEIHIKQISKAETVPLLIKNIYRPFFLNGMKMEDLRFKLVLQIANSVVSYSAKRPENEATFLSFTEAIINEICQKNSLVSKWSDSAV